MSELKPCPFCGAMPTKLNSGYTCSTLGCALQENTVSAKEWNTRPIEDALNARIAELSQAVGLITTLKPTMVMDANRPLDMVREVAEHVTARITNLEAANRGWCEQYSHELNENIALQSRIAELEAERRWIPVSERLPEVDQDVLVFDQRGDITIDYLVALNREGVAYYTNSDDGAVCWMPLPEPPIVYGKVCEE